MNRRSGFTLTELLMALVIHSFFILILGGTFYTLLSFGSRSQEFLTARERGQRALNYIDTRVRNTGLGMWKLPNWQEARNALKPLTNPGRVFKNTNMRLPLMIWSNDIDTGTVTKKSDITHETEDEKIYCGNVLTLLYAQREEDTRPEAPILAVYQSGGIYILNKTEDKLNKLIEDLDNDAFWQYFFSTGNGKSKSSSDPAKYFDEYTGYISDGKTVIEAAKATLKTNYGDDVEKKIDKITEDTEINKYLSEDLYPVRHKFLYNRTGSDGEFYYSRFGKEKESNTTVASYDIRAWGVSRGAGIPFTVYPYDNNSMNKQLIKLIPSNTDYPVSNVPNGDELLYLRGVTVFADDPLDSDPEPGRSLKIKKLESTYWPAHGEPYQTGILEIYAELDTSTNILSVWVLSTGGRDNMIHDRPSYEEWPMPANWLDDFKYHVTYISKGVWKLNNLKDGFGW